MRCNLLARAIALLGLIVPVSVTTAQTPAGTPAGRGGGGGRGRANKIIKLTSSAFAHAGRGRVRPTAP